MTDEQIAKYKEEGKYGEIILAAHGIMICFYLMYFCFDHIPTILGKKYRFTTKWNFNKILKVIDEVCSESINFFHDGQNDVAQNCIDLCNEIEDKLNFEDKHLYILYAVNDYNHKLSKMYPENVHSIYESKIEYIYKNLISNLPVELDANKMLMTHNAVHNVLSRLRYREEEDTSIIIVYVDENEVTEMNLYKDAK